jgi:glyoxylase-like metal-dependent hydrolase (beta-lactamase superfamily II)
MRVHHLNCGTMRPAGGRLIDGVGGVLHRAEMVCHTLLIETGSGLVLVDTGFGTQGVARPFEWLGRPFIALVGAQLNRRETAAHQIVQLGYSAEDVRDIVVTHLDIDHAGGLADFPEATVHVSQEEYRAATAPRDAAERQRCRAAQFAHRPKWRPYATAGGRWFGFDAVRDLDGLPDILFIPLAGHSGGHAGVAVDTGDGWLLHAGDAYFFHGQIDPLAPHCPPGLRAFQAMAQADAQRRRENVERLQELAVRHGREVDLFSSHSAAELRRSLR